VGQLLAAWRVPLIVVGLSGIALTVVSFAFAAANTVPTTKAGDGEAAITGYTVSSVVYTLNSSSPQNIDQVAFNVDSTPPAGSKMRVKLVSGGSTWYTCTNVAAALTCDTTSPQATVVAADELRIVIAQ
jgi:hypothetical protein